jgi:hypothetical protein
MEKQKLPNEQAVMILGLLSFIGCCCSSGILGVILSGIGLYLANKSEQLFKQNPEQYNLGSLNTWKIVNIVSLAISAVFVIRLIYLLSTVGIGEMQEQFMQMMEEAQSGQ